MDEAAIWSDRGQLLKKTNNKKARSIIIYVKNVKV